MRVLAGVLVLAVAGSAMAAPDSPVAGQPQAAPAAPPAPKAKAKLPTAGDLFARYRLAIGGEAAVRRHTSRRTSGRFELPAQGIGGVFEMLAAAPDRMRIQIDLGGLGSMQRGYDGTNGWALDPAVGPRLVQGAELDEMRHSADFYYDLHDPASFKSATVLERAAFEGRDCYTVRLVRPGGFEVLEYFDAATGLLAGFRMNSSTSMGTVPSVVTVLEDYRSFGGVQTATRARQRAMGIESVMIVTAVDHAPIPASAFEPPAEIQALRKQPRD
jgi:hypothetical protein